MSIFLGLGTNIGDKAKNLEKAKDLLKKNNIKILKESSILETPPYGPVKQDYFLNQVIEVETKFTPEKLLKILKGIEQEMGRVHIERWGPRIIDLDILFYGETILHTPDLTIPQVDIENRKFILEPLSEIAPNFAHPVFKKSIQDLLQALKERDIIQ